MTAGNRPSETVELSRLPLSSWKASANFFAASRFLAVALTSRPPPVNAGTTGEPSSEGQSNWPTSNFGLVCGLSTAAANQLPIAYIAALPSRNACWVAA